MTSAATNAIATATNNAAGINSSNTTIATGRIIYAAAAAGTLTYLLLSYLLNIRDKYVGLQKRWINRGIDGMLDILLQIVEQMSISRDFIFDHFLNRIPKFNRYWNFLSYVFTSVREHKNVLF